MSAIAFVIRGIRRKQEVFFNPAVKGSWTPKQEEAFSISVGSRARSLADDLSATEKGVRFITVWRK